MPFKEAHTSQKTNETQILLHYNANEKDEDISDMIHWTTAAIGYSVKKEIKAAYVGHKTDDLNVVAFETRLWMKQTYFK